MAFVFPFFGPKANRSGTMPVALVGRLDGTVGNSGDTTFSFGGYPQKGYLSKFIVSQAVLMTSGSTVTGQPTDFFVTAELLVAE